MASKFNVGDSVLLVLPYQRHVPARETTVTKVGRKYVYVEGGVSAGYDKETGRQTGEWSGHTYIETREDYELALRRKEAESVLRGWGIEARGFAGARILDVYDAVRPIFETEGE